LPSRTYGERGQGEGHILLPARQLSVIVSPLFLLMLSSTIEDLCHWYLVPLESRIFSRFLATVIGNFISADVRMPLTSTLTIVVLEMWPMVAQLREMLGR